MKYKLIVIATIAALSTGSVHGQQAAKTDTGREKIKEGVKESEVKNFAAFGSAGLSNFISHFSLSSTFKEGENGKVELAFKPHKNVNINLAVDQKIGKKDEEATPYSLNGVSPGTTVSLAAQFRKWNIDDTTNDSLNEQLSKSIIGRYNTNHPGANVDPRGVSPQSLYEYEPNEQEKKQLKKIMKASKLHLPFYIKVQPSITKTAFAYATDSIKLNDVKENYLTPTITVSFVKLISNGFKVNTYLAFSYTYSEYYKGKSDMNFTLPFGTTNNMYSKTIAFGKPVKKTTNDLTVEARHSFDIADGDQSIAVAFTVNAGIDSKALDVQLPIYFIRGKDGKGNLLSSLQGGVRFGYSTQTDQQFASFKDGFTAQLIVTQPLNILK